MDRVCAVVVTHNRRERLRECLVALAAADPAPDRVLVVDNASTDGTLAMLAREHRDVEVLALDQNQGGAGGFHEGMRRAHEDGARWLWLMDDDTVPEPGALGELLAVPARVGFDPALLASTVRWEDGRLHPMNIPWPERVRVERAIDGAELGLVAVRLATFCSLLVHHDAVRRHGLPLKHFFIWSDDVEYTSRMVLAGETAYMVPSSIAVHRTPSPYTHMTADPARFYYHVRNTVYMIRGPGRPLRDRIARTWVLASSSLEYLLRHRTAGAAVAVLRGLRDGVRRIPGG